MDRDAETGADIVTTPHPTQRTPGRSAVLAFPLVGALPGLMLVLIAQIAIEGEQQLTVGVAGIGAVAGAVVAGESHVVV
jgi:cobalamin synthase